MSNVELRHLNGKRASFIGLVIIIFLYVLLAFAYSEVMPFNKGPDEGINLDYIEFIAVNGRLPVTYEERELVGPKANWPPLYHLVVASASNLLDVDLQAPPDIKIFWNSFRYRALDLETESVWYLSTEDQERPFLGKFFTLHLGRWFSILFSATALILVYLIILELLPQRPWLAFTGTAILAFIPTFIFLGAALNEDALIAALVAFYLWLLIRIIKQPGVVWPYWIIGLVMGISITVKYTTVVLPFEILLILAAVAWWQGFSWVWWLKRVGIVAFTAILAASWWFGWNFWFLNEIDKYGFIPGLLRPLFTGGYDVTMSRLGNFFSGGEIGLAAVPEDTQVGTFTGWVKNTALSFWGVGIGDQIPLSPAIFIFVGGMVGIALFGLWYLWKRDKSSRHWLILLAFHTAIFVIAPLVRFGLSRRIGQTAQGRHILIPAAAAIMVLLVWGLATAIPRRWQRFVLAAIIAIFLGWSSMHLYRLATYSIPPLPMRTLPEAAGWLAKPVNVTFDDSIELVSYQSDTHSQAGLLKLDLAWRSLAHVNQNYLLKIELIDAEGAVVSHWQGYNGQGRVPTLAWDPGDSVFDRLVLPLVNLPAGVYDLELQLLGRGGPLILDNGNSALLLTEITLDSWTDFTPSRQIGFDVDDAPTEIGFELWQVDGPAQTKPVPVYRYPGTITVITDPSFDLPINVELLDETGQVWQAAQRKSHIHTFVIGPRWASGNYRVRFTLNQTDNAVTKITNKPVLRVENWWERQFEAPEIAVPMEANFANQLKFLGYELPQKQVKAGEAFPVTLYWQALPHKSPEANFIQFNHLLDENGTLQGGYDRRPLEYYSTLLWAPGEVVVDGYAVPVDPDAPPGEYFLDVGYYIMVGESAVNLPLVVDGEMTGVSSAMIGPIMVLEP